MKFTLSWLKEYLETDACLEEILHALTAIGLEVEAVDDRRELAPFIIAKVIEAAPHPEADKLQVLTVESGAKNPLQIVCGASNARKNLVSVLAKPGTYVPGIDTTLSLVKIRNVESQGMLCSESELGLSSESEGIIELAEDAPIGASFSSYAGLSDPIIEVAITPNRGDCTAIYGIARDLAAKGLGRLKKTAPPNIQETCDKIADFHLDLTARESCLGFATRVISGIKNGPSPSWMQQRLQAIGLRPINMLVDVTNYITFALGRPLHVFDAKKLQMPCMIRSAKEGEIFHALNNKDYSLKAGQIVISDTNHIASLCGIIGGEKSACDEQTTEIILESALWNPSNVAKTGRNLAINSDARYRFERGVDPLEMEEGLDKAAALIAELGGGKIGPKTIIKKPSYNQKTIVFSLSAIKRLTNLTIEKQKAIEILKNLGFTIEDKDENLLVTVPSWRHDIFESADLVEEITRLYGIEHIQPCPLPALKKTTHNILTPLQKIKHQTARVLASRAMNETIHWSFITHKYAEFFSDTQESLQLENPISTDMSDMRESLLPGLLQSSARNRARGFPDLSVFEIGHVYKNTQWDGQILQAAGVRMGQAKLTGTGRFWRQKSENVDVYDAKEDALAVLEECGLDIQKLQITHGTPHWYHPGRSGVISLGPKNILGYFGEFHPKTLELFSFKGALCGFELFLEKIPQSKKHKDKAKNALFLSNLQPIYRDFSFIVEEKCEAASLLRAALGSDKKLIKNVKIFDVFVDQTLGKQKKSIAIEVEIQPVDKNLTEEDLEVLSEKIISNILKTTQGTLRDK